MWLFKYHQWISPSLNLKEADHFEAFTETSRPQEIPLRFIHNIIYFDVMYSCEVFFTSLSLSTLFPCYHLLSHSVLGKGRGGAFKSHPEVIWRELIFNWGWKDPFKWLSTLLVGKLLRFILVHEWPLNLFLLLVFWYPGFYCVESLNTQVPGHHKITLGTGKKTPVGFFIRNAKWCRKNSHFNIYLKHKWF